jgi:DNA-directed RNA polymerase III subunit RPC7
VKQIDPFNGMESYTNRYLKPKRRVPELNTRPYGWFALTTFNQLLLIKLRIVLNFFPKELWSVLDPINYKDISTRKPKRRRINGDREELEEYDPDSLITQAPSGDSPRLTEGVKKRIDAFGPDEAQEEEAPDPEADPEPEDDDFGEPELEGGDDYDAEAYFNDGGDDMDGGDDANADGGDYY